MTEGFDIISKMDPMARRALAAIEAVQKAIELNNTSDIEQNLMAAENAISVLKRDLNLHNQLNKSAPDQAHDRFVGSIHQFDNTASDYKGTEGGVVLGVSRHGRDAGVFQPHRVV